MGQTRKFWPLAGEKKFQSNITKCLSRDRALTNGTEVAYFGPIPPEIPLNSMIPSRFMRNGENVDKIERFYATAIWRAKWTKKSWKFRALFWPPKPLTNVLKASGSDSVDKNPLAVFGVNVKTCFGKMGPRTRANKFSFKCRLDTIEIQPP